MKRIGLFVVIVSALALFPASPSSSAQEGAPEGSPDMAAMMKEMQERMAEVTSPGEQHAAMAHLLGDWDVNLKLAMPGVPAQSWPGKATYEWLIEGRWMGLRIEGQMMGMPFESFSIAGFDVYAKNHVVATVNNFDTSLTVGRGVVVDPSGMVTAVYGTLDEYITEEIGKPFKVITRITGDDSHVIEIWDLGIGEAGAIVLEYAFTRRAS